jgi:hypothetical protein
MSYRFVESFQAATGSADGTAMAVPSADPKPIEFHSKIKFEKISASSWFYYKEIIAFF